eukprot:TRINITY_DN31425_c0_g1_i1.p1 TRINITY_DN31425_c0_g1~~TRINITY_DN31425_c0_g1_i1.p1  ORF type:complete len:504 (-),score=99.66 TRINITY_DN31425_c0_g1_i1:98-1609(-)
MAAKISPAPNLSPPLPNDKELELLDVPSNVHVTQDTEGDDPVSAAAFRSENVPVRGWALNDASAVKNDAREMVLNKEAHDVTRFYKDRGFAQHIARHAVFENTTLLVIACNAVWIAVDTDHNKADTLLAAHPVFITAENIFCVYFTFEWLMRFLAFRYKRNCLRDGWFVFDSVLVFFMVMETWVFLLFGGGSPFGDNTAILRLFRLLRLSRLIKMLKSLPELMILIRGMVTAMASVVYVLLLLILFTYVFAIACTQMSVDAPYIHEKYFDHVALSMYSLLVYATFLDALSDFCNDIRGESIVVFIMVVVFICLSALTVMNMLIGVLCEVIASVAATEKEMLRTEMVKNEMTRIWEAMDENGDGQMSKEEMANIVGKPEAIKALHAVEVDPDGMVEFADTWFQDDETGEEKDLPFIEFLENVLDLRGTNTATVKDIMSLQKNLNQKMKVQFKSMDEKVAKVEAGVKSSQARIEAQLQAILEKLNEKKGSERTCLVRTDSGPAPP